jgi:hypothetical protein
LITKWDFSKYADEHGYPVLLYMDYGEKSHKTVGAYEFPREYTALSMFTNNLIIKNDLPPLIHELAS